MSNFPTKEANFLIPGKTFQPLALLESVTRLSACPASLDIQSYNIYIYTKMSYNSNHIIPNRGKNILWELYDYPRLEKHTIHC